MTAYPFPGPPAPPPALAALSEFRQELYGCLEGWRDTAFELCDALLAAPGPARSLPELSLEPAMRRSHGSGYKALRGCEVADRVRDLLAGRVPDGGWGRPVLVFDQSTWPRPDAETSPGRGYCHTASKGSSGKPVVAGWSYQVVVAADNQRDSWAWPLDQARIEPGASVAAAAAAQARSAAARLPAGAGAPVCLFDGGYDAPALAWELAGQDLTLVVRVRDDRVFHEEPPPRAPGAPGRPRRHGPARRLREWETWPAPARRLDIRDRSYGRVSVKAWDNLHPALARRGHWRRMPQAPIVPATVVRVEVERLPGPAAKPKKPLWLWVSGAAADLDLLWRAYLHRFDIEHVFRLCKTTLGWTTPKLQTPQQADTWTWLVLAAYAQLRLACTLVDDLRRPWERPPRRPHRLSPTRTRRGFGRLARDKLGTPAQPPKTSTPGPGRPKGSLSGPRKRYPVAKKSTAHTPKTATKPNPRHQPTKV